MAAPIRMRRQRIAPGRGTQNTSKPGVVWRGLEVIADNINRRGNTLNRTRRLAMEKLAKDMENFAKGNATWDDRTGNARARLQGVAVHNEAAAISTAYLSHGVPYGVWLELMNSGEFAIIMPTVLHFQERLMSTVVEVDTFASILGPAYSGGDE